MTNKIPVTEAEQAKYNPSVTAILTAMVEDQRENIILIGAEDLKISAISFGEETLETWQRRSEVIVLAHRGTPAEIEMIAEIFTRLMSELSTHE